MMEGGLRLKNYGWTNWGFVIPCLLFSLWGGGLLLLFEQGHALYWFAGRRTDFWDTFFVYGTQLGEEPMYAVLTILALFLNFRLAFQIPLLGFTVMGMSHLLKNFFLHRRPRMYYGEMYWPDESWLQQLDLVEDVHLLTGMSSFPSGHTMSGFGLFCLFALYLRDKWKMGMLFFLMAAVVGLSRIYLFQHFLKDVVAGALVGVLLAHGMAYLSSLLGKGKDAHWMDASILAHWRKRQAA